MNSEDLKLTLDQWDLDSIIEVLINDYNLSDFIEAYQNAENAENEEDQ